MKYDVVITKNHKVRVIVGRNLIVHQEGASLLDTVELMKTVAENFAAEGEEVKTPKAGRLKVGDFIP